MALTRSKAEKIAREFAVEMSDKARERNALYAEQTGQPSSVSDADYARMEAELFASMMRIWEASTHATASKRSRPKSKSGAARQETP